MVSAAGNENGLAERGKLGGAGSVRDPCGFGPDKALFIAFGLAAYFTGSLYGKYGQIAIGGGFVAVVVGLYALGGLRFG